MHEITVQPPAGFIDFHPDRGTWRPPTEHPMAYEPVEILKPNCTSYHGVWTGAGWWSERQPVEIIGWRRMRAS